MKASLNLNFTGVAPRRFNNKDYYVIPIAHNPTQEEIDNALKATKTTTKPMEGYNGEVFWLGEDLVVKRFKGEKAFSNDPYREINMLDTMYDADLLLKNSQVGQYAFIAPDETAYLVSTRIGGKNPKFPQTPFNKENLASLLEIITQMDQGGIVAGSNKDGGNDLCRFMNYDFNGGNINITEDKTGLFDFEYSGVRNLDELIRRTMLEDKELQNCHRSDASPVPSSLRSFEFYCFCDYLKSADNASELFEDYLEIKGQYHKDMAKFYREYGFESDFNPEVQLIANSEEAHSRLLKKSYFGKIPKDIKTSEAIKIQMSNFMHEQSQFCDTGKINSKQLQEFTTQAIKYFETQYAWALRGGDLSRITYYNNCIDLMLDWQNVNVTLADKIKNKDKNTMRKLTDEHIPTILEKMDLSILA